MAKSIKVQLLKLYNLTKIVFGWYGSCSSPRVNLMHRPQALNLVNILAPYTFISYCRMFVDYLNILGK